jgi:glycosyltransferase involved in cell wall biosynthesis
MKNNKEKLISIALCTCNGEKYLSEQLESISKQTVAPFELVLSDDASTDKTRSIIEDFAARANFPVLFQQNPQRLGVVNNFSQTLSRCRGRYITLCDQDDIWLPGKLESDLNLLTDTENTSSPNKPLLVHSDPALFYANSESKKASFMQKRKIQHIDQEPLKRLLVQNFVTGCTAMVNKPLLEIALPVPPQAAMHDWWLALVAASCGKIIFNDQSLVYYRQHQNNHTGVKAYYSSNSFKRLWSIKALEKELASALLQAASLSRRLSAIPGFQAPHYLDEYLLKASRGGMEAVNYTCKNNITKAGRLRNLVYIFLLAKRKRLEQTNVLSQLNND